MLDFLETHRDQSGIIYCGKRDTVDALAARLAEAGWPALPYHAGLDDATRQRNQRHFVRADSAIMVATIAFGMGINKPNVRFVLHFNLPKDVATAQYFIDEGAESERPGRTARLQAMMRYAQATGCRRTPLLAYFGETFAGAPCNACDRCLAAIDGVGQVKLERYGEAFLSALRSYCAAKGLPERPKAARAAPALALAGGLVKRRFVEVGELFASGMSIEQLQAQYGVQLSTIMGHLANFQRQGGAVDRARVLAASTLTPEQQAQVLALFDELGAEALAPIFQALDGAIPYEELHVMRVVYLARP